MSKTTDWRERQSVPVHWFKTGVSSDTGEPDLGVHRAPSRGPVLGAWNLPVVDDDEDSVKIIIYVFGSRGINYICEVETFSPVDKDL